MRSRTTSLDTGLDYHYLEWDPGARHTVVLVHGFLDFAWGWKQTAEFGLSERFHVIAPDMRGHGDSGRVGPGGYYYFLDYVADLASLIAKVGRDQVSLVGHSMGGSIASYYAGTFPDRVHKLALLEGLGPREQDNDLPDRMRKWIDAAARMRTRSNPTYPSLPQAAQALRNHDPHLDEQLALELARHGTTESKQGLCFKHDPLHLTRGPIPYRVGFAESFWKAITCPVLLVDAESSDLRYPPGDDHRRRSAFSTARSILLEGAGHMLQRHQPAALAAILAEFLGDAD